MANAEPKPKPWWKSRKILTAFVTGVATILAPIILAKFGIELDPLVVAAAVVPAIAAILGIAHEDGKIIAAKVMAEAVKEGAAPPK